MHEKIRILHIIHSFSIGGTEKQCIEIFKNLDGQKYDQCLVTLNQDGPLRQDLTENKLAFFEFRIAKGYYSFQSLTSMLRLACFIRRNRFDIVQTYGFYSAIPGIIAGKLGGARIIIAGKRDLSPFLTSLQKATEKFLWRFCDVVVVNSQAVMRYIIDLKCPPNKVTLIYNGLDPSKIPPLDTYRSTGNAPCVGMIANFRKEKDHKTFLDAASLILKTHGNVRFCLLGEGYLERDIRQYAAQLGITNSVVFCGVKTGSELYKIIASFSVSVLTSETEGMPNALIESLACGVPVVANNVGGIPEIINNGVTGFLVEPKDAKALAEKILCLLENKQTATDMAAKGLTHVYTKFSNQVMAQKFEALYEKLLGTVK